MKGWILLSISLFALVHKSKGKTMFSEDMHAIETSNSDTCMLFLRTRCSNLEENAFPQMLRGI